ncbi:MAG: hypothetical protein KC422_14530 [Trueperaceae bacterium]|nr:hypothetical protein [Trueperaceae bacterium]
MKKAGLAILSCLVLAFAQTTSYEIIINGQSTGAQAIVLNGQTYVPLESLQRAGVAASYNGNVLSISIGLAQSAGGANQRDSLEGCINQDFFNGIWRLKVLSVDPVTNDNGVSGWGVTLEMKNGSSQTLAPADTGISGTGEGIQVVLADGTIWSADPYDVQTLTFASLPQGGGISHQLKFFPASAEAADNAQPQKFLFEMKPDQVGFSEQQAGVAYSTATPSLRVHLDCRQ